MQSEANMSGTEGSKVNPQFLTKLQRQHSGEGALPATEVSTAGRQGPVPTLYHVQNLTQDTPQV